MVPARTAWGTMRIVALPLTRAPPPRRIITYYNFAIVPPQAPPSPNETPPPGWRPQDVVKWASGKINSTWVAWGEAERGSWRFRVFDLGERFLDRIDFEEGALKKIDVKTAPPAKIPDDSTGEARQEAEAAWSKLTIPLAYPPSVSSGSLVLSELRTLLQERIPAHNRGFYTYAIIAPLTAPFMLVPVIPNLPFFFCAWRAWSHYQALRGARHLEALLQSEKIIPEPDTALDAVYTDPETTLDSNSHAEGSPDTKPTLIVTRNSLAHAMRLLDVKPDEAKDMLRAYEQATNRIR